MKKRIAFLAWIVAAGFLVGCDTTVQAPTSQTSPAAGVSDQLYARVSGQIFPVWRDQEGTIHLSPSLILPESLLVESSSGSGAARTLSTAYNGDGIQKYRWTDGVVPYQLSATDAALNTDALAAMTDWAQRTGVTFVKATAAQITANADRIVFTSDDPSYGCYTIGYGKMGGGQKLIAKSGCRRDHPEFIKRGIGFYLGIMPLVSRPDRATFLKVDAAQLTAFGVGNWMFTTQWTPYGIPDVKSISMEGTNAWRSNISDGSIAKAFPIFFALDGSQIPAATVITEADRALVRAMVQKKPTEFDLPKHDGYSMTFVGRFMRGTGSQVVVVTPWKIELYRVVGGAPVLTGTTTINATSPMNWTVYPFDASHFRMAVGDLNGDGVDDLRIWGAYRGIYKDFIALGNGTFQESNNTGHFNTDLELNALSQITADLDNDKKAEVISWVFDGSFYGIVWDRPTESFYDISWKALPGVPFKLGAVQVPGHTYKALFGVSANVLTYAEPVVTAAGMKLGALTNKILPVDVRSWAGPFVGNMGTGAKGDIVFASPTGQVLVCTSNGFTCTLGQLPEASYLTLDQAAPSWGFADLNGDGFEDLIATQTNKSLIWTNNQKGTGWIFSQMNNPVNLGTTYNQTSFFGDFDGNGVTDIYQAIPQGPSVVLGHAVDPRETQRLILR